MPRFNHCARGVLNLDIKTFRYWKSNFTKKTTPNSEPKKTTGVMRFPHSKKNGPTSKALVVLSAVLCTIVLIEPALAMNMGVMMGRFANGNGLSSRGASNEVFLPGQLANSEDQHFAVPLVSDTTLDRSRPNTAFENAELIQLGSARAGLRRAVISFDSSSVYTHSKDLIEKAVLRLHSPERVSRRPILAQAAFLQDLRLADTTWNCEYDSKTSNVFKDCPAGAWKGGLFSLPAPEERGERTRDYVLEIDVTDQLNQGANALALLFDGEDIGNAESSFYSLDAPNADLRPTLTVTVKGVPDVWEGFPGNTDGACHEEFIPVKSQNTSIELHAYVCPSTGSSAEAERQLIWLGHGVPYNGIINAYILGVPEYRKELTDRGDVVVFDNLCKGRTAEIAFKSCPSNDTFEFSAADNEAAVFLSAILKRWPDHNIAPYEWDRLAPVQESICAILGIFREQSYVDFARWALRNIDPAVESLVQELASGDRLYPYCNVEVKAESWIPSMTWCSEERAALPPGDPMRCSNTGFWVRACAGVLPDGSCFPMPKDFFVTGCMGRALTGNACSLCVNDEHPVTGERHTYWYNSTFAGCAPIDQDSADPIRRARNSCYELNDPPISGLPMPEGVEIVLPPGMDASCPEGQSRVLEFSPQGGFGIDRQLTPIEQRLMTQDQIPELNPDYDPAVDEPRAKHVRRHGHIFPASIPVEGTPAPGELSSDKGVQPRDDVMAAIFRNATEQHITQRATLVLDWPFPDQFFVDNFKGRALLPTADREWAERTLTFAGFRTVKSNYCHASPFCNPFQVAAYVAEAIDSVNAA